MIQNEAIQSKHHFYWIDSLRFVSALLVVACHYRSNFFIEYGLLPAEDKNICTQLFFFITRLGNEPVLVFFVLSGFLVGGRAIQRILNNDVDVKIYFIDRLTRILLPLIASLLLVIGVDIIIGKPIPFTDIIGSLFSLQGIVTGTSHNSPLWSLAYEVWFYILMGCIIIMTKNKNRKNVLLAFFIFALCIYIFSKLITIYLLVLLMGTFAFFLPGKNIKYVKVKIFILLILLVIAFVLAQLTSPTRSFHFTHFSFLNIQETSIFLALITALLIHHIIAAKPRKKIWIKIENISSKLSDFSYTLYLTHFPLMYLLTYFGLPKSDMVDVTSLLNYLVAIAISIVSAYLIYLVSEKQTPLVKNYIKKQFINTHQVQKPERYKY